MLRSILRPSRLAAVAGVLLLTGTLPSLVAAEAKTYLIDNTHTRVGFRVRHMVAQVRGEFKTVEGTIVADEADLSKGQVNVKIDAASINTNNEKRDGHLRTADFFDTANHPTITFVSKSVNIKDGKGTMTGDLTMRGVTKPVTLDVAIGGFMAGNRGRSVAGFGATGTINRKDFGINWNRALDHGGTLLSDEVVLEIEVEALTAAPPEPQPAAAGAASGSGTGGETKK
ncbi:MAG: YceI family protein [Candidatus Eiseniibacteriota bacterium]